MLPDHWGGVVHYKLEECIGNVFTQVILLLTEFQTHSVLNLYFPRNVFHSSHESENNGNAHEEICDRLLFFPLDFPPVQRGFVIHGVFEELYAVCLSCSCVRIVWLSVFWHQKAEIIRAYRSCSKHNSDAGAPSALCRQYELRHKVRWQPTCTHAAHCCCWWKTKHIENSTLTDLCCGTHCYGEKSNPGKKNIKLNTLTH